MCRISGRGEVFGEHIITKAFLALSLSLISKDTTIFVGRLGITQREIWRMSSSQDPVCIARFPIQPGGQSWKGLKIAVNPVKDEILVPESVDEESPDAANLTSHFRVSLQKLSFSGKRLGRYKFDCWNTDGYGFGFTPTGCPFAACLTEGEKGVKMISLNGTQPSFDIHILHDLLLWNNISPNFAELLMQEVYEPFRGEITPKLGNDVVNVTPREIKLNGVTHFTCPFGMTRFEYGSRTNGGLFAIALEGVQSDGADITRAMTMYSFAFGSKTCRREFDAAYVVVARAGSLPVRISQ